MASIKPVFRIFDYDKTMEFYVGWLGFEVDWQHGSHNSPVYLQVSRGNLVLHLSEHHGDACPGARILIEDFPGLAAFHQHLLAQNYKYNKPGLEQAFYDPGILTMEVIDPFGNRLTFTGSGK